MHTVNYLNSNTDSGPIQIQPNNLANFFKSLYLLILNINKYRGINIACDIGFVTLNTEKSIQTLTANISAKSAVLLFFFENEFCWFLLLNNHNNKDI
jgi:hypothetical protein